MKDNDSEKFIDIDKALKQLEHSIAELPDVDTSELRQKVKGLREELYRGISRWERIEIARAFNRPGTQDFINGIFTDFMEVHGDRIYGDDPAVIGGLAMLDSIPVVVIGHKKHSKGRKDYIKHNYGMAMPSGHHKAIRLMRLAERFGKPVITFVDTPGAYPGPEAESQGQAFSIAQCISSIASIKTPVISCIIGEAGSGGALAIGFGDRIIMLEHAFYSSISPEGFSSIIFEDTYNRKRAADVLKGSGSDLLEYGIVDHLIPEPTGGAHNDPKPVIDATGKVIRFYLKELLSMDTETLLKNRAEKIEGLLPKT